MRVALGAEHRRHPARAQAMLGRGIAEALPLGIDFHIGANGGLTAVERRAHIRQTWASSHEGRGRMPDPEF
jgi:hypothetical protein